MGCREDQSRLDELVRMMDDRTKVKAICLLERLLEEFLADRRQCPQSQEAYTEQQG